MRNPFSKYRPRIASGLPAVCALLLFILAGISFAEAINSPVIIAQPIFGALIAFVVVATVCWEWKIFGNPNDPEFLAAHVGFGFAVFFLINTLFTRHPKTDSLIDKILDEASAFANLVVGISERFFDMLYSPAIPLVFLGVCIALSMRKRTWAIGALFTVFFGATIFGLIGDAVEYPGWLLLGVVLLVSGIFVIRRDYLITEFWRKVHKRLEGDTALRGDLELKRRLLKGLHNDENGLSSRDCCGKVARALKIETSNPKAEATTIRVVRQMVEQDRVAVLTFVHGKTALALHPDLQRIDSADVWVAIARVPKMGVVTLIAVVWILSPIDLIPDSIPVVGMIDDVLVALFGAGVVHRGLSEGRENSGPLARIQSSRRAS